MTIQDVLDTLSAPIAMRGAPKHIRIVHDPEFIAQAVHSRFGRRGIDVLYIGPGSPWSHGYLKRFLSRFSGEFLALEMFASQSEALRLAAQCTR